MWQRDPTKEPMCVYREMYTSDDYLKMEEEIALQTPSPGPGEPYVENVILPIKGFSDLTMLTNFGSASLWPIYWWFAFISKYTLTKPSLYSAYHMAYIPSVCFFCVWIHFSLDTATRHCCWWIPKVLWQSSDCRSTYSFEMWSLPCNMEALVQNNPRFREAYQYGIVLPCIDDILCRFFIRYIFHSCDYLEK